MQLNRITCWLLAGATTLLCAPLALAQGDGSGTDNPDLLRGGYSPFCEPAMLCHYGTGGAVNLLPQAVPMTAPQAAVMPLPPPPVTPARVPLVAPVPVVDLPGDFVVPAPVDETALATHAPVYPVAPRTAWDLGYGLTLRGSYVNGYGASRFEMLVTPEARLSYRGARTQTEIEAELTLVQPTNEGGRLSAAEIVASTQHQLDQLTALTGRAVVRLTQDDPSGLSVAPGGVMTAPLEFRGEATGGVSHRFGQATASASAGLVRFSAGDTQLIGGGSVSNAERDYTRYQAGLRLGYAMTPIIGAFVSGDLGREDFDTALTGLGITRSGWTYGARMGLEANWQNVTTLEASVGSGWRTFDAAGINNTQAWLYGLALRFNPNATTQLRAAFDTAMAAGSGTSAGGVDYTLTLEAAYRVNQWLGLRASGEAIWEDRPAPDSGTNRYRAGVGADILIGPHSEMVLDYAYGWRNDPLAATPLREEHRVSAGLSLQY